MERRKGGGSPPFFQDMLGMNSFQENRGSRENHEIGERFSVFGFSSGFSGVSVAGDSDK